MKFETVTSPGGTGHYIEDYRCGGSKPFGGGRTTYAVTLNPRDVVQAMAGCAEGLAALKAWAAGQPVPEWTPAQVTAFCGVALRNVRLVDELGPTLAEVREGVAAALACKE